MFDVSHKVDIAPDRLVAFQNLIREARINKGCKTQQQAEDAVRKFYGDTGVSQAWINNLERGLLDNRQWYTFYRYIHWLGFTMSEVMQTLGLEKALDVEENDRQVRLRGALRTLEDLPPARRESAESAIIALVSGYK